MDDVTGASAQRDLLMATAERIAAYRGRVDELAVFPNFDAAEIIARLGDMLDTPTPAADVIAEFAAVCCLRTYRTHVARHRGHSLGGCRKPVWSSLRLFLKVDQSAKLLAPTALHAHGSTHSSRVTALKATRHSNRAHGDPSRVQTRPLPRPS